MNLVTDGQMFGRWRVVSSVAKINKYGPTILVECVHTRKYVLLSSLERGISTACPKCPRTRIENYSKLRGRWEQMIDRCENPNNPKYDRYGGRGIRVSEEFKNCRFYCGYIHALPKTKEQNHIDRIDNDKGYERGNLRWATASENNRNKNSLNFVVFNNKKMCLTEFIEEHTNLSRTSVKALLKKKISTEEISKFKRGETLRRNWRTEKLTLCRSRWSDLP